MKISFYGWRLTNWIIISGGLLGVENKYGWCWQLEKGKTYFRVLIIKSHVITNYSLSSNNLHDML